MSTLFLQMSNADPGGSASVAVTQTLIHREGFAVSKVLGRSMQLKRKKKTQRKKVREWWSGSWIKSEKKKIIIK